jgi:hypothetical protein
MLVYIVLHVYFYEKMKIVFQKGYIILHAAINVMENLARILYYYYFYFSYSNRFIVIYINVFMIYISLMAHNLFVSLYTASIASLVIIFLTTFVIFWFYYWLHYCSMFRIFILFETQDFCWIYDLQICSLSL